MVYHFHCTPEVAKSLPLHAGDDAAQVMWLDVSDAEATYRNLYASHKEWVDEAARRLGALGNTRSEKLP